MGRGKNSSKRKVYSNIILTLEPRKITNNLILHFKQLERWINKTLAEESIKIREEINRNEKKKLEKINESKIKLFEKIKLINI